jgi:hypothetical protein
VAVSLASSSGTRLANEQAAIAKIRTKAATMIKRFLILYSPNQAGARTKRVHAAPKLLLNVAGFDWLGSTPVAAQQVAVPLELQLRHNRGPHWRIDNLLNMLAL